MGSRHLRLGLLWTVVGLGAIAIGHELDPLAIFSPTGAQRVAVIAVTLALPVLAILLGARELSRAAGALHSARAAGPLGRALRAKLGEEFVVLPRYRPRDDSEHEVGLVVVGPPGVFVIEARDDRGELVCYQDHWYRRAGGRTDRIDDSPSKRARWNATRVRNDVAVGGFIRTPVEPLVVFTRGRVSEASSSSVPAVEGIDGAIAHLRRPGPRVEASPQRTRALMQALLAS